jgi:hypothetical protein
MDVTSITCGSDTRDKLAAYRDANDFGNYDEALRSLLQRVEDNE